MKFKFLFVVLISILGFGAILLALSYFLFGKADLKAFLPTKTSQNDSNLSTTEDSMDSSIKKEVCTKNNGKWLAMYSECENISNFLCSENGGDYNRCAKSCRHEAEAKVCTRDCVQVCQF